MNRALLVIDVQESFRQRSDWAAVNYPDIADRVSLLVNGARSAGELVVWVLHTEPGTGSAFDPDSGQVQLIDGLEPRPDEPVLRKTSHNAFTTTNLQQILTRHGVGEVVISGIRTEQCCETTARVASDLGFAVSFVTEATATMPLAAPGRSADRPYAEVLTDPTTLPADILQQRTEAVLAGRFATIRTLAEMEALFLEGAGAAVPS